LVRLSCADLIEAFPDYCFNVARPVIAADRMEATQIGYRRARSTEAFGVAAKIAELRVAIRQPEVTTENCEAGWQPIEGRRNTRRECGRGRLFGASDGLAGHWIAELDKPEC